MKNTVTEAARLHSPTRTIKTIMDVNSVARQQDHLSLGLSSGQDRWGRPARQLSFNPSQKASQQSSPSTLSADSGIRSKEGQSAEAQFGWELVHPQWEGELVGRTGGPTGTPVASQATVYHAGLSPPYLCLQALSCLGDLHPVPPTHPHHLLLPGRPLSTRPVDFLLRALPLSLSSRWTRAWGIPGVRTARHSRWPDSGQPDLCVGGRRKDPANTILQAW